MEIEAKFLLENSQEIEEFLKNYSKLKYLEILDIYFDDENFNLLKKFNSAFRIRKENENFYITIKRKLNNSDEMLFKRQEFEFKIDSVLFDRLKNSQFYFCFYDINLKIFPIAEIFSRRKLYLVDNLKVSIDRIFFGEHLTMDFIEIEGEENKILNFIDVIKEKFKLKRWNLSKLETYIKFSEKFI
ncbi:MAG: CYTH domain-containing protein [candidate division WOR-3 bacterium]|jgi:hypothetical protein